jgi:hypothetical protein
VSFPAVLAAVAARGPRCSRCTGWTMDPEQTGYGRPMCDACATELEQNPKLADGQPIGPVAARRKRPAFPRALSGPVCPACAVWRCLGCGWARRPAWRGQEQSCADCGGVHGTFHPVRHKSHRYYVHAIMNRKV